MKTQIGYTAVQSFDPSLGDRWCKYIEWSKLDNLKEVVSLDCSLCSSIINELIETDWEFKVYEDIFHDIFGNLDYLQKRIDTNDKYQILAVIREPDVSDVSVFKDSRFIFKGYDLIDVETRISSLTNCGGFDLAFQNTDLTESGLIFEMDQAYLVKELLLKNYRDQNHADYAVWAIWKMQTT